jgi:septal ring factor EnvC (AmiA/AmiB activator)
VTGLILRRFGTRLKQESGATPISGIEIGAPERTPVRIVHDGTVVFADTFAGFGNLVIVQHDGRNVSMYGHLLDMAVSKGDRVARGGLVGGTGASPLGGAGLYFELRIDARPVDPLQWLRKR